MGTLRGTSRRPSRSFLRAPAYRPPAADRERLDARGRSVPPFEPRPRPGCACSFCRRPASGGPLSTPRRPPRPEPEPIRRRSTYMYQCPLPGCQARYPTPEEREAHLVRVHLPPDLPLRSGHLWEARAAVAAGAAAAAAAVAAVARATGGGSSSRAREEAAEPGSPSGPPGTAPPEDRNRIPSLSFGQGSTRGFENVKKRSDRH